MIAETVGGCILVFVSFVDVFQSLFHPAGRGTLSDWIARGTWRSVRPLARRRPGIITYAGPLAFVAVISTWAALIVVGCALIFWPHMSTGFVAAPRLNPPNGFFDAFNTSLSSLTNFATDSFATQKWLRLVMGIEGVVGFGLLTASVSWLLSLYPVLELRRSLAQQTTLLHWAELENGIDVVQLPSGEALSILDRLTSRLTTLRNQVAQFPITYYFHVGEEETALPGVLPYLAELGSRASQPGRAASVRLAGTALGGAVDSYLELIAREFLRMPIDDKSAILRRHAADQMRNMVRGSRGQRAA